MDLMTGPFATRLFRIVFVLAGCYNLAFGLWASIWPLHFFTFFQIELPRYPAIWACLGMVVGIYGLLYWYVAWKPEDGRPIVAVGLLGKLLGPVGMAFSIGDDWPRRLAMLNVYNDLIWWMPFSLFLIRGLSCSRRLIALAPALCAALHAIGFVAAGLILRHGVVPEPDVVQRARYIAQHSALWTLGWCIWMAAAASLVGFYAWWGAQLAAPRAATMGVLLAAMGFVCDVSGESLSVLMLVERSRPVLEDAVHWDRAGFEYLERIICLLTAGAANLLYTLGGIVLMLHSRDLPFSIRAAMAATWISGIGMTLAAIANHVAGLSVTTVVLFPLLIAWVIWIGHYWRRA
jgi:hypothetical protein